MILMISVLENVPKSSKHAVCYLWEKHTKGRRWGALIQVVDTYYLVICSGGKVPPVWRKSNRVNRAQVMAHMTELSRLFVGRVAGVVDGLRGPNPHMAIAAGRRQSLAIGRNVAAVHLEILLFACRAGERATISIIRRLSLSF